MSVTESALSRLEPFAAGVIAAGAAEVDAQAAFPDHTVAALRETGLLGLLTPVEHGGMGGNIFDSARVVERIARSCGSSAMVACTTAGPPSWRPTAAPRSTRPWPGAST